MKSYDLLVIKGCDDRAVDIVREFLKRENPHRKEKQCEARTIKGMQCLKCAKDGEVLCAVHLGLSVYNEMPKTQRPIEKKREEASARCSLCGECCDNLCGIVKIVQDVFHFKGQGEGSVKCPIEKKPEELSKAQRPIEKKPEELSKAQRPSEKKPEELPKAQRPSEKKPKAQCPIEKKPEESSARCSVCGKYCANLCGLVNLVLRKKYGANVI